MTPFPWKARDKTFEKNVIWIFIIEGKVSACFTREDAHQIRNNYPRNKAINFVKKVISIFRPGWTQKMQPICPAIFLFDRFCPVNCWFTESSSGCKQNHKISGKTRGLNYRFLWRGQLQTINFHDTDILI